MNAGKPTHELLSLCTKRGFLFDGQHPMLRAYRYGPLGAQLKRNLIDDWWKTVVTSPGNIHGFDGAITVAPSNLEIPSFCAHNQLRTESKEPDLFQAIWVPANNGPVSTLNSKGVVNAFRTSILQALLSNYSNLTACIPLKMPFGMAEIGRVVKHKSCHPQENYVQDKCPHSSLERIEEHDEAGMLFFSPPIEGREWYAHWQKSRLRWWKKFAYNPGSFFLREFSSGNTPVGVLQCSAIQYTSGLGTSLVETIVNHGELLMEQHMTIGKEAKLEMEGDTQGSLRAHLLSCAMSVDVGVLALLFDCFSTAKRPYGDQGQLVDSKVMRLHRHLAPIKVAVLPKTDNQKLHLYCRMLTEELRHAHISTVHDTIGTLEQRLALHDETGTPYRIVADDGTLETGIVSLQDRDTTAAEDMNGQDILLTLQKMIFGTHMS